MSKRGRKPILTDVQAQKIVDHYIINNEQINKVKYIDIHRHCKKLFEDGKLERLPNESYWRKENRTGRQIIDKTNNFLNDKLAYDISENNYEQFIKIIKKENISNANLNIIRNELKRNFDIIQQKSTEAKNLQHENEILEKKLNETNELMKEYHELLINIYYYTLKRKVHYNQNVFEDAFNNIFSNPLSYTEEFREEKVLLKKNNISDIFKNKLK